jgi:hypothetical protein
MDEASAAEHSAHDLVAAHKIGAHILARRGSQVDAMVNRISPHVVEAF